ncbi:transport and Golgi organization protein 1 homolog isoform X2 [Polyodon spathula]|uniref:transport and Golgi organization protein 1 homolog isoform X2 n=1 Tax=Polyodon spathula TaxID=7913 RepID=UPI001B7EF125|nr:transport and Golgi organization protein 1 homolog isoform X2 [Polyodon spathula]
MLRHSKAAGMAAFILYLHLLNLLFAISLSKETIDRRFSDLKRCTDEECSILMCRGKAAQDFSGPDCRFLKFKKGETIYVYYKLAGRRTDVWAGSVGSSFGYFPKDLLEINHIYTEKELEIPTEETDFVCFDSGLDKFDIYDLNKLLGPPGLLEGTNIGVPEISSSPPPLHSQVEKSTNAKSQAEEIEHQNSPEDSSSEEAGGNKTEILYNKTSSSVSDKEQNKDVLIKESKQNALGTETSQNVQEEPSETESPTNTVGQENQALSTDEGVPHPLTDYNAHQNTESSSPDDSTTPNDNAEETSISQGEDNLSSMQEDGSEINNAEELLEEQPIPELKTTMESTFDAVVSGEEETRKVTPVYDDFSFEEDNEETHQRFEMEHDESSVASNVIPLLSYSEDNIQPEVDNEDDSEEQSPDQQEGLSDEQSEIYEVHATEKDIPEDKSLWTTLGNTVFAIVSGGERTNKVTDFEDKEEEGDAEYLMSKEEEPNEDRIYLLGSEKMEDQEKILEMPEAEIEDLEKRVTNEHMDYESEVKHLKNESVYSETEVKSTDNGGGFKPDESALIADSTLASESSELSKTSSKEVIEDQENAHDFEKSLHLQQKEIHAEKEETLKDRSMEELDGSQTKDKSTHIESDGSSQASEQHEEGTNLKDEDMVDQNFMKDLGEEIVSKELELRMDKEAPKDVVQNGPEDYLKEIEQEPSDQTVAKSRKTDTFENEELFSEEKDKTFVNETTVEDTDEQMDKEKPQANSETANESTDKSEIRESGEILNAEETVEPELDIPKEEEEEEEEELLEDENAKVAAAADFGTGTVDSNLNNTANERGEEMTITSKTENLEIVSVQSDVKLEVESQHVNNSAFKEAHNETDLAIQDDIETGKADDLLGIDSDIKEIPAEKIAKLGVTKPETDSIGAEDNSAGGEEAPIKENSGREHDGLEYIEANIPELSEKDSIVDTTIEIPVAEEPEHSDGVRKLILLKGYFDEKRVERFLKYLGPQHILRVEAMFQDLEDELKLTRQKSETKEDIEKSLDRILESSETSILDEIEEMLDEREVKYAEIVQMNNNMFDEEAAVLDDFQEMAFYLRQKYSTASDSTPLAPGVQIPESTDSSIVGSPEANLTETNRTWSIPETEENSMKQEEMEAPFAKMTEHKDGDIGSDVGIKGDTHFERTSIKDIEDVQKIPENPTPKPLNTGFGFNMDHYLTGAPESSAVPDDTVIVDGDQLQKDLSGSWFTALSSVYVVAKECMGLYAEILVTALPEDWQPGPNFYGMPWEPVIITFLVGYFTFIILLWRTLLAVKNRTYLLTEKQLGERIQLLVNEKCEVLEKMSELKQKIEESEQQLVESEKTQSSSAHENEKLQEKCQALQQNNENLIETLRTLQSAVEEERKKNLHQEEQVSRTQKSISKLQSIIQTKSAELSKVQTVVEEARVKEEAVKAELQSVLKENNTLKDSKQKLLKESRSWEEQYRELSEKIKTFQKSQKDLEDSIARKDNEIEVLSDCITELRLLETVELQKGDATSNVETQGKKNDAIKNKIKLLTDVSRIKTTLTIVEEERDRYCAKLLDEENSRHQLEEQIQKLEHDHAALSSEKSHLENEFKTMQQKLEIMNELYQQKENALQQKLTQEEYERREKEQKLSEVDGKAVQVVEELKIYKQRIQQIEEELQKTERSYKNQISSHEKKAHENWLNARAAERALVEEKRETANLRQKLVEVNDKLAEIQKPSLIKPTPGRQDRQIPPPRRGTLSRDDSYGPSPVSGGAPSPPPMIEGPGRPPSAPVGRREPFGHMDGQLGPRRPPSETSGRFHVPGEHGLLPPFRADVGVCAPPLISSVPRTSSPNVQLDGSVNAKAEGPPSFPGTPIMNSPVTGPAPPPKGFAPPPMTGPPNGHAPRPIAGHSLPAPGPRYGPPHPVRGPYGPRPYGPSPPLTVRGPLLPHRDYPPGSRDFAPGFPLPHGPRDYPFPPKNMPSGTGPPPGMRDYPGPQGPSPQMGPRDYPPGPGVPPQQVQHRDFSSNSQNGP